VPVPAETPAWVAQGADAWPRADGRSLVFRNGGGAAAWVAGLRGQVAAWTDPAFLTDPLGRIRAFPSAAAARAACDATLAGEEYPEGIADDGPGDGPAEAAWP
jgi:hypothetical protein